MLSVLPGQASLGQKGNGFASGSLRLHKRKCCVKGEIMLHIYYGRENLDKEKFLFDRIAGELDRDRQKILLMVPDQYTLQAERSAFACLGVDGLIDLEVMSLSRLGFKVLSEVEAAARYR